MKRNWLTSVAIVAALVAGSISSNALADNKGFKVGGSSFQHSVQSISQGNGSNTQFQNLGSVRNLNTQGVQTQQLQNQGLGGLKIQKVQGNLGNLGINLNQGQGQGTQIKKLPGNLNPGVIPNLGSQVHLNQDLTKKLGIGTPNIHPSLDVTKSLNKAILGEKFCKPGCNPGCNPCNKWCGPCWWFCPWYVGSCSPCYPTIYYYPEPIVVEVPVVVTTGVATEVVAEKLMQIPVGATLTLQGKDLGDAAGQVVLQIDKVSLPAQINEWKADAVNVTLPMLGLAGSTKAQLWLVKADGAVASKMAIELIPAQQPQEGAAGQAAQGVAK